MKSEARLFLLAVFMLCLGIEACSSPASQGRTVVIGPIDAPISPSIQPILTASFYDTPTKLASTVVLSATATALDQLRLITPSTPTQTRPALVATLQNIPTNSVEVNPCPNAIPPCQSQPTIFSTPSYTLPTNAPKSIDIYNWNTPASYVYWTGPYTGIQLVSNRSDLADPNQALLVAFANFSPRIAYVVEKDHHQIELWVADLNLTHIERLWSDDVHWLRYISAYDDLRIKWGPKEGSIIVTNFAPEPPRSIIYDIASKTTVPISGSCDRLGLLLAFSEPTLP